ncbi:hypothetical protein A2U01_0059369, partial [Trifolium medium]|nr:hypothetical protein [Trifolium medium]
VNGGHGGGVREMKRPELLRENAKQRDANRWRSELVVGVDGSRFGEETTRDTL